MAIESHLMRAIQCTEHYVNEELNIIILLEQLSCKILVARGRSVFKTFQTKPLTQKNVLLQFIYKQFAFNRRKLFPLEN